LIVAMVGVTVACGAKGKTGGEATTWMEKDVEPVEGEAAEREAVDAAVAAPENLLIAGHAQARYSFVVPEGLGRLRGLLVGEGESQQELNAAGPDGVGIAGQTPIAFDSVAVFSDPLGLGVDMGAVSPALKAEMFAQYEAFMSERFPSATEAREVRIGPHVALRIDLPRVEMRDRPLRSGRHYLVLDGAVTVSVDCLWTAANAERMSAACDAVTSSLRRR
jgi:hypothetical protein